MVICTSRTRIGGTRLTALSAPLSSDSSAVRPLRLGALQQRGYARRRAFPFVDVRSLLIFYKISCLAILLLRALPVQAHMAMNDESGAEDGDETEDDEDEDYDGETTQYSPFFGNAAAAAAPAAPLHTETSFDGISTRAFPRKVTDRLVAPVDPNIVEIKPDGTVYLPEIMYRRILNSAFGPGGWALMPRGPATHGDKFLTREWALFCHGRFVAQASGESEMYAATAHAHTPHSVACLTHVVCRVVRVVRVVCGSVQADVVHGAGDGA